MFLNSGDPQMFVCEDLRETRMADCFLFSSAIVVPTGCDSHKDSEKDSESYELG